MLEELEKKSFCVYVVKLYNCKHLNYYKIKMKIDKKKILVLGGSGFLGTNIILKLNNKRNTITSTYFKNKNFHRTKNVKYLCGDLRNFGFCKKITRSADIVFMCAAVTSGAEDIENNPMIHVNDNVKMNVNIIKHENNLGYGAAINSIFEKSQEIGSDILVTFDADGQHKIDDIETVIAPIIDEKSDKPGFILCKN